MTYEILASEPLPKRVPISIRELGLPKVVIVYRRRKDHTFVDCEKSVERHMRECV